MDKKHKGEIHVNGKILPIISFNIEFNSTLEPSLEYDGQVLPANQVPNCEISLCEEKATQKCDLCFTPICNGHAKAYICHYCRLSQWMYEQRKNKS